MRHTRLVGTPEALAPEVMGVDAALDDKHDYGASVDWWGLGILTVDIFTGLNGSILIASGGTEPGRRILSRWHASGLRWLRRFWSSVASALRQWLPVSRGDWPSPRSRP